MVFLLDDSLPCQSALIHSFARTCIRTHKGARTHTPNARARWGGGLLLLEREEEGGGALLIKAHQGRSFSTGGRVVQQYRDTPAQRHGAQTVRGREETG